MGFDYVKQTGGRTQGASDSTIVAGSSVVGSVFRPSKEILGKRGKCVRSAGGVRRLKGTSRKGFELRRRVGCGERDKSGGEDRSHGPVLSRLGEDGVGRGG